MNGQYDTPSNYPPSIHRKSIYQEPHQRSNRQIKYQHNQQSNEQKSGNQNYPLSSLEIRGKPWVYDMVDQAEKYASAQNESYNENYNEDYTGRQVERDNEGDNERRNDRRNERRNSRRNGRRNGRRNEIYKGIDDGFFSNVPNQETNRTSGKRKRFNAINNTKLKKSIDWAYKTVNRIIRELRTYIPDEHRNFIISLLDKLFFEVEKVFSGGNNYYNYYNYYNTDKPSMNTTNRAGNQVHNTLFKQTRDAILERSYLVLQKAIDLIKYSIALLCENALIDSFSAKFKLKFVKDLACNVVLTNG